MRVALWLAVGGREQLARLLIAATGVGLGVGLLLLAAVALPAIRAHEARAAWTTTAAHNVRPAQNEAATDPLLWRVRVDTYRGQDIMRLDVAALGPRAPLPPGLSRLPGPGEKAVSPALARLLAAVPPEQLTDRYPGRAVATVGDAALRYPDELVVVVGYAPADLRGQPAVEQVHSIETYPSSVSLTRFGRVIVGIAAAALLVPILVLVGTATRLSAVRREQRLAAIRLVGGTPRQVRTAAAVEAALAAVAGTVLGFGGFALVRPYAARWSIDGSPFFPADLRLSWASALLVVIGVPVLAVSAAVVALRRVQISPLGVTRQAQPGRPTWRRLILLIAGLGSLAVALPTVATTKGQGPLWLLAAVMSAVILGIVVAGPWLTIGVGRLLVRISRRASTLLAGHRLAANPTAGFRSISGLVLAVLLVTVAAQATASAAVPVTDRGQVLIPAGTVGAEFLSRDTPPLPAAQATALAQRVRAIPGVHAVLDLRWAAPAPPDTGATKVPVLARCAALRATGLGTCPNPDAPVELDARMLGNGLVQNIGQPATDVPTGDLPMLALLVATDARPSTMETVRTAIESFADQTAWLPWTTDETKLHADKQAAQVNRISTAVLLVTLFVAGFSLAVSTAGGLLERKRPFALLRLAGTRPTDLHRVMIIETALPMIAATVISAGIGFAVAADITHASHTPWRPPPASYWWTLAGGVATSLAVALLTTIPLMTKLTAPHTARFE
ncbi:FtsX-like permease family protein [Micromonospora sp. NPDC005806]|uniref:FtsX-like permease family protein n=1 Tax=Micromonospora sp. NPDC005806 TaxID=3364234 RepID=UPI0036CD59EC